MECALIIVLLITIPVIMFPVALIWYLNIGGIYLAIREATIKSKARKKILNSRKVTIKVI